MCTKTRSKLLDYWMNQSRHPSFRKYTCCLHNTAPSPPSFHPVRPITRDTASDSKPWIISVCDRLQHRYFTLAVISRRSDSLSIKSEYRSSNTVDSAAIKNDVNEKFRREVLEERTIKMIQQITDFSKKCEASVTAKTKLSLTDVHSMIQEWIDDSCHGNKVEQSLKYKPGEKAEALLLALEQHYDQLYNKCTSDTVLWKSSRNTQWSLVPHVVTYNLTGHAFASCDGGHEAALRAEALLHRMIHRRKMYESRLHTYTRKLSESSTYSRPHDFPLLPLPPEPTTITFSIVLNAWAKSKESGPKCEELFRMMEQWDYDHSLFDHGYETQSSSVVPNARCLSAVVEAWTNSTCDHKTDRVLAIFNHVIQKWKSHLIGSTDYGSLTLIRPNNVLVCQVLNALAKSGRGRSAAEQAEKILYLVSDMVESGEFHSKPNDLYGDEDDERLCINTRMMTLVIECWAKCVSDEGVYAAEKSESILLDMELLHLQGKDVKPNRLSFTSCIFAWANCDAEASAERAEAILKKMILSYQESKDEDLKPDTMAFNTCITAYARSHKPDAYAKAESLLAQLAEFGVPDTATYNALLDVCSKSGYSEASEKALALMSRMEHEGVEKNSITYNTVIDTLAKSRDIFYVRKAVEYLDEIIELGSLPHSKVKPSTVSFTSIFHGFSKSAEAGKSKQAYAIFQKAMNLSKLNDCDVKPDVRFFSAFLSVCANENGDDNMKRDALKMALKEFENFSSSPHLGKPNHYTYSALLKVCGRLAEDTQERCRLLEHVFTKCIEAQQVSKSVLYHFERGAPRKLQSKLLHGLGKINENESSWVIPSTWCDNVIPKRDRPCCK